jgi:hypothetical protein
MFELSYLPSLSHEYCEGSLLTSITIQFGCYVLPKCLGSCLPDVLCVYAYFKEAASSFLGSTSMSGEYPFSNTPFFLRCRMRMVTVLLLRGHHSPTRALAVTVASRERSRWRTVCWVICDLTKCLPLCCQGEGGSC